MKIPLISDATIAQLEAELKAKRGGAAYKILLDLAEDNPLLSRAIGGLASKYNRAIAHWVAMDLATVVLLIQTELEKQELEQIYFPKEER